MHSVLFVCAANICRSPMAMGLLQWKVNHDKENWLIKSAGVWALENQTAARHTQKLLSERGVDLSNHHSRLVNFDLVEDFNLILVMERNQKEALKTAFPNQASKIYLLSEMVSESFEIVDPVGGSLVDFRVTAQEIEDILNEGFNNISRLSAAT